MWHDGTESRGSNETRSKTSQTGYPQHCSSISDASSYCLLRSSPTGPRNTARNTLTSSSSRLAPDALHLNSF